MGIILVLLRHLASISAREMLTERLVGKSQFWTENWSKEESSSEEKYWRATSSDSSFDRMKRKGAHNSNRTVRVRSGRGLCCYVKPETLETVNFWQKDLGPWRKSPSSSWQSASNSTGTGEAKGQLSNLRGIKNPAYGERRQWDDPLKPVNNLTPFQVH